jgi:hypothetical protein
MDRADTETSADDLTLYEGVRVDFEAGVLSLREVAAKHSADGQTISHATVANWAKRFGWSRNLKSTIRRKAEEKLQRDLARAASTPEAKLTESRVIEANATRIAQVRGEHRADIQRARALTLKLFEALEAQLSEELRAAADALAKDPASAPKINVQLMASVNKQLIDALAKAIELERDAYGINDNIPEAPLADDRPIDRRELARHVAFMLTREALDQARRQAAASINKAALPN